MISVPIGSPDKRLETMYCAYFATFTRELA